jgi:hypothetical protein
MIPLRSAPKGIFFINFHANYFAASQKADVNVKNERVNAVVPKLCAAAPQGAAIYSTRPTNYDLFIQ